MAIKTVVEVTWGGVNGIAFIEKSPFHTESRVKTPSNHTVMPIDPT